MYETKSEARLRRLREMLRPAGQAETEESGFTLIELMVVLLIMAILLAIAIPTFLAVTGSAKKTATQSNLTNVITSATALYSRTQSLPTVTKGTKTTGLITRLHKTQATITFYTSTTGWPKVTTAEGHNVVMTKAVTSSVAIFTGIDANKVCWAAAINETTKAIGNIPAGNSFYGVALATSKGTCNANTMKTVAATTWKPNFKTTTKSLT
jgi:prepilin-type N-terminal cleavage/methylation domain-containing protein